MPTQVIALLRQKPIAGVIAIASLAIVGGSLFFTRSCPAGQARQNGNCAVASSTTDLPTYKRFVDVPNLSKGVIRYGGSRSFASIRASLFTEKITREFPQLVFKYVEPTDGESPNSTAGIQMLLEGEVDVAQSSRLLKDEERDRARTKGFELEEIPVAKNGIVFYVNPKLKVPGLTLEQVRQIYAGEIRNWAEVGGSNVPIQTYMLDPKQDGTARHFKEKVMKDVALSATVKILSDGKDAIREVGQNSLGGIGFDSTTLICPQTSVQLVKLTSVVDLPVISPCNGEYLNQDALLSGRYPLMQDLYVIVKKDGGRQEQIGIAYANLLRSRQGQDNLLRFDLVPILQ